MTQLKPRPPAKKKKKVPAHRHNTHMHLDKDLWQRACVAAALSGRSITRFVEEALEEYIAKKRQELDGDDDDPPTDGTT